LLRHLILVDEKSSTYKIALLRVLAHIADTAAGLARHETDSVVLPLGLVSLFWLRMFKPLIENALPQMPFSRVGAGPSFVTNNFTSLRSITAVELRVGALFHDQMAKYLHRSLLEISQVIRDMPANYLRCRQATIQSSKRLDAAGFLRHRRCRSTRPSYGALVTSASRSRSGRR
jgi:hypothetical protein